jgi:hypothetical protein
MNALILGYEEVDRVNIQGIQERDVDLVVRFPHGAEPAFQVDFWRHAHPCELFELLCLTEGYRAALSIAVAADVICGALVNEDPDTVLCTQLLHCREFRRDLLLVLKPNKDVGINEKLATGHSRRARVCKATHTNMIAAAQIRSDYAVPSARQADQAGAQSRG